MSSSITGSRELPASKYDLSTYWGRVKQAAEISDPRTLLVSPAGLENAKALVASYKGGRLLSMTPELWHAKKVVDSTLHPDTGEPVFFPFRMSCFVLSNLIVTAGMLTPGLTTTGTLLWQITNQSLNVAINNANANKSTTLSTSTMVQSYLLAVSASCSVALGLNSLVPRLKKISPNTRLILGRLVPFAAVASAGALNVFLMRGEEIRQGIDIYPVQTAEEIAKREVEGGEVQSLGKSKRAATLAVGETAISRVLNATPIMVLPPLILVKLQKMDWLKSRPRLVLPVNLGLILTTSVFALPLALGAFPQRQAVKATSLEEEFWERGGSDGLQPMSQWISNLPPPSAGGGEGTSSHQQQFSDMHRGNIVPVDISSNQIAPSRPSGSKEQFRRKGLNPTTTKQITRTRVRYSCDTCRRRKVKCDKVHPNCGNCSKTGSECIYDIRPVQQRNRVEDPHNRVRRRRDIPSATNRTHPDSYFPQENFEDLQHDLARFREQQAGSDEIVARLSRLTGIVEQLSRRNNIIPDENCSQGFADHLASSPQVRGDAQSEHTSRAVSRAVSRQSSPRRHSDNTSPDEFPIPAGHSSDLVDPVGTLNLGHLSLEDGGKSRYVGTTYWAYISDEIHELNQLLRDQNRSQPPTVPQANQSDEEQSPYRPHSRHREGSRGNVQEWLATHENQERDSIFYPKADLSNSDNKPIEADMLDYVPSRHQSNILYKAFMSGVQAISPVLHPPTILICYDKFWCWYDQRQYSQDPCPSPSFIPLLYAIWYGGSVTMSLKTMRAEFDADSRSSLTEPFHDEVTRWLKIISFPRSPSLHGLAAFLLVQTILSKEEEPLTSSLFISLALRVAQTMGLHRDPAQFGIPHSVAEPRRRMWWHIVHMDGVVAMSSGLPPLVSDENYWDVRLTSEVKDSLLGSQKATDYERAVDLNFRRPDKPDDPGVCGSSMVNVYYISAKGKYIMARAIRNILKIQLGTKPVTRKDMQDLKTILVDLQSKLHALVDRIPVPKATKSRVDGSPDINRSLQPDLPNGGPGCGEQYHTPVLAAFHKWARILLSLFVHKAFCVAYQPFLKNAKSQIWPAARQCALRHCHGFMEKFVLLATDPDFQPFQWSWPGNHQPMHATMIMLIDLYERPTSPEAPKSRAFIDKIFSLSGPDGGVVGDEDGVTTSRPLKDGGRQAWDMMRRLREKAWQKAGLNPQLLWTEQAQVQAGVVAHASPVASATSIRSSEQSLKEQSTSPAANFVDSYYAIIKDSFNDRTHVRRTSAEVNRPKERQQNIKTENNTPIQPLNNPPASNWLHPMGDTGAVPQTSASPLFWPSPPTFQDQVSSRFDQISATNQDEGGASLDQQHAASDYMDFNPGAQAFLACLGGNATGLGQKTATSPTYVPELSEQTIYPHEQDQQHQPSNTAEPNVNFDWDQWDAVFGQYLPIVDGHMDLDGSVVPPDNPLATNTAIHGAPDGDNKLNGGQIGAYRNTRNWADFG
ncbi:hypothetical protein FQN57_000179 [Myotisia sp. PD_48]|nr:hypothetical protein FQN57_000179 [Myotisia sp. PD_48]